MPIQSRKPIAHDGGQTNKIAPGQACGVYYADLREGSE
jgi:hypothetical protein